MWDYFNDVDRYRKTQPLVSTTSVAAVVPELFESCRSGTDHSRGLDVYVLTPHCSRPRVCDSHWKEVPAFPTTEELSPGITSRNKPLCPLSCLFLRVFYHSNSDRTRTRSLPFYLMAWVRAIASVFICKHLYI